MEGNQQQQQEENSRSGGSNAAAAVAEDPKTRTTTPPTSPPTTPTTNATKRGGAAGDASGPRAGGSAVAWPDRPADEEEAQTKNKGKKKKKGASNALDKKKKNRQPEENDDDDESSDSDSTDEEEEDTLSSSSSSSSSFSSASTSSASHFRRADKEGAPAAAAGGGESAEPGGSGRGGGGGGSGGGGVAGEESSGSWAILGQLGSKPRKETFGDDKESRRQYRQAKKDYGERKRTLIDSLTADEVREYKKEKKELTEKERLERKRERDERRRLVKEKKKLYKKPKIGKLVTQETKSYELVCDMLLGIRVTVSKVSARPLHGNTVKDSDFRRVHNLRDFTFRDYAPVVFRRLREHFGIEADDYLISLTGDYILSELVSPGQSGQFFYFSYDLRFMLKTITRGEAKFLKAILPKYYNHIIQNPSTLIARFFGFHRVAPHRDRKHYFVVMGNIFAQNLELHYRFDLKGSTVGRVTPPEKIKNDPNVVMKDQDFDRLRKTIALGPEKRKVFIEQVDKDVALLDQLGIMDYSLLVGIHDRRRLQKGRSLSMVYLPKAVDDERLATAKGFNADTDTDSSDSESDEEKLEQHHVTVFTQDQGGIQSTDEEDQGTDYIYFLGIIDILQPFNMRKRAEHGFKSFRFDGDQISAVNPRLYARRFKDYVFARVRQPDTPQTPREVIGLPPRLPEGTLPPPPIHPILPSTPDLFLAAAAAMALLIWWWREVLTPFLPGRTGVSHHDDDDHSNEGNEQKQKQKQLTDLRGESDGGGNNKVKESKKSTEQGQGQAEEPPVQTKRGATTTTTTTKPAAKKTKKKKKRGSEDQAATKTADSSKSYDYEASSSAGSEASSGGRRENREAAAAAAAGEGAGAASGDLPHSKDGISESSPRVGNAGLVPKQLKVKEKKKKQKQQHKASPRT